MEPMPLPLDRAEIKAEARSLMRCGSVRPVRMTALFLAITFFLSLISDTVTYLMDGGAGMIALPLVFVSILISLVSLVLNAGYTCYCLGIHRREQMPYTSLFDAFSFAGKVILLAIVQGIFIFLWSLLFIIPGFIAFYRYRQALYLLLEHPEMSALQCISESKRIMAGHKGELFVMDLSFIGWALLIGLADYLGAELASLIGPSVLAQILDIIGLGLFVQFFVLPYMDLTYAGYYVGLTRPVQDTGFADGWTPDL